MERPELEPVGTGTGCERNRPALEPDFDPGLTRQNRDLPDPTAGRPAAVGPQLLILLVSSGFWFWAVAIPAL